MENKKIIEEEIIKSINNKEDINKWILVTCIVFNTTDSHIIAQLALFHILWIMSIISFQNSFICSCHNYNKIVNFILVFLKPYLMY